MKGSFRRVVSLLLVACMCLNSNQRLNISGQENGYTAHAIAQGASFEGNPLKGFVPFDFSTTDFPHSLEWFYLPVNSVQTGMNEFDWTALEKRLDAIADRGHQAVMRFYYDYPAEESGVPQFLIDQGLEMRYYNEPNDLGGDGYCPDYENETFRKSMINFIKAFGEKYDGDERLGYVTLGLLGFWGEWHNWPYDEDTSDGKADWSISTQVYKETLDAFDDAFDITKLCVREPKSGIDYNSYDMGFHDDSFGYATLTQRNGGQSWSFMQKMVNFNLQNSWETNCIGGEIYPPSQYLIFSGATPDGSFQDWELCMEEAHATWMLCEAMKHYTGTNLTNARAAAMTLGYDFRVSTAYYSDVISEDDIYLKVDIKNIGSAPFYYDHNMWPVEIGVKQGNTVVKSWRTEWDLCDIKADGSDYSFEHTVNGHGLNTGNYSICIKVINPLENGNILGFANATQGTDGWLNLGTITVLDQNEEPSTEVESTTEKVEVETTTENKTDEKVVAWETEDYVYCNLNSSTAYENWQLYIDTDINNSTGYLVQYNGQNGFEYLIENGTMYLHNGNDSNWSWREVTDAGVTFEKVTNGINVKIPKSSFANYMSGARVQFKLIDASWNTAEQTDVFAVKVQEQGLVITDDIEIYGYQISPRVEGFRTIYSCDDLVEGQKVLEVGLIYGIDIDEYNPDDMIAGSASYAVYMSPSTDEGRFETAISKSESYAMTMLFAAGIAEEFNQKYYVRAYAKLADGTYAYTAIENYTIYAVADYLYQNRKMSNQIFHDYLYTDILKVVDEEYVKLQF